MALGNITEFERLFVDAVKSNVISYDEDSETGWASDNDNILKTVMQAIGMLYGHIDNLSSKITINVGSGIESGGSSLGPNEFFYIVTQASILSLTIIKGEINRSNLEVRLPSLSFKQTDRVAEIQKTIAEMRSSLFEIMKTNRMDIQQGAKSAL